MRQNLLIALLMVMSWIVGPATVNSQPVERGRSVSEGMKPSWERSRNFKKYARQRSLTEKKIALQLAKTPAKLSVPDKMAYGYLLPGGETGLSTFSMKNPRQLTTLYPIEFGAEPHVSGGAYADGKYYSFFVELGMGTQPVSFGYIDLETGDISDLASYSSQATILSDMTYDYSTQTMYALSEDTEGYSLSTVDLENGISTKIAPLGEQYFSIAATYDGILYAINSKGELVILNKKTGRPSVIGSTGIIPKLYQSMDFDHTDGTLYWSAVDEDYNNNFCVINLTTGKATVIDHLGGEYDQIIGLYIPFTLASQGVPGAVTDFRVTHGDNGAEYATLSWVNPVTTFGGGALENMLKVEIYRDNLLIHTVTPVEPGQVSGWKDDDVATGNHVYKVVPYNAVGKGTPVSTVVFIGRDVPSAVSGISLAKIDDSTIKINWEAPVEGIFGGWIDASSLKYKITRYPGEVVLEENLTATEFTDRTIKALNRYSYLIEVFTADGNGEKAVSEAIVVGPPVNLPYSCSFIDESETSIWTIVDHDKDGNTWMFNSGFDAMFLGSSKNGAELMGFGGQTTADDWMISPEFILEKGKSYKLTFSMRTFEGMLQKMKVTLGNGASVEAQTIDLGTFNTSTVKGDSYIVRLPDHLETGRYNVGFHLIFDDALAIIQINSVAIEEDVTGTLTGQVVDGRTSAPLEGAVISLNQDGNNVFASTTDVSGAYTIRWVPAGEYELVIDKKGYQVVKKNIRIEALKIITEDASLEALAAYALSGKVVDATGAPMEGVELEISGYDRRGVHTDAEGTFTIPALYHSSDYYIAAFMPSYLPYLSALAVTEEKNLGNITLQYNAIPPQQVAIETGEAAAELSWSAPVETNTFRYDSEEASSQLGLSDGTQYTLFGSVYRIPAVLRNMSWITSGSYGSHETVNVYVMDLDGQGQPTSKVLFSESGVPNTDGEWTTYTFTHPVDAPNGFMVAVSCNEGAIGIGCAESTEDYPFLENTNFYSQDYRTESYIPLEKTDTENNLMIRAEGVPMYQPMGEVQVNSAERMVKDVSKPSVTYSVYRIKEGDESNKPNWKKVASGVTGDSYADTTWPKADKGIYKYAITAVYNNHSESLPAFSGVIPKGMDTEVSVHINLTGNVPVDFAALMLENIDHPDFGELAAFDENGDAKVKIVKGFYRMTIAATEYKRIVIDRMDFSTEDAYSLNYSLYLEGPTPFNLQIDESTESSCTISWNHKLAVADDFEGHESFKVNSPGLAGWTYIDGDDVATEEISGLDYPNAGTKMAYIVMDPSVMDIGDETRESLAAHSGSKYLVSTVVMEGVNDDYIISPELNFKNDFILSFYAKSYTAKYGLEEMRIGYSLTGNEKEDFIWLTTNPVRVSDEWENYLYTVPAGAKYVTIHCVSDNRFFFMLDDVFIGYKEEQENMQYDYTGLKYKLYLDGNEVGETDRTTYTFNNLSKGKHVLGVQTDFASGVSEIVSIECGSAVGIHVNEKDNDLLVYPNPVKDYLHINGDYTCLTVMSLEGVVLATQESGALIDMSKYKKGVYLIRIVHHNKTSIHKVIVE